MRAGQLGAHVPHHFEVGRHVLEHLGYVFADPAQGCAALGAGTRGKVFDGLAWQLLRQHSARWALLLGCLGDRRLGHSRRLPCAVGFELLDQELELADLGIEFLGGAAELQAAKLRDEQLQVLDLVIALGELGSTLDQQTLERVDVVGQI